MSNQGSKTECKVSPIVGGKLVASHEGLVHIVETRYDDAFTPWYGSFSVICNIDEFTFLVNAREALLLLEDGRTGHVRLMGGDASESAIIGGQIISDERRLLYFVGTSRLSKTTKA